MLGYGAQVLSDGNVEDFLDALPTVLESTDVLTV